jgi:protein-tyrosine phosphatase
VLVHCTAGKDRTGFVVAMVLAALGVPRDAIVDDYLESSRRRPPAALAQALVALAGLAPSTRALGAIEAIASVSPDFLDTALGVVERDHGGADAYLAACGVHADVRDALHTAMLD